MGDLFSLPENSEEMLKYPQIHMENPLLGDGPYLADEDGKYLGNMYFEGDFSGYQPDMDVKPGDTIKVKVPKISNDLEDAHKMKLKNRMYIDAKERDIGPAEEAKVDKINREEREFVYLGSNFGLKLLPKEPYKNLVMENWDSEDVEVTEKTGHQSPEEYMEKSRIANLAYGADYVNGDKDLNSVEVEDEMIPKEDYKKIMRRDIEIDDDSLIYYITPESETLSTMKSFFSFFPWFHDHQYRSSHTNKIMRAVEDSLNKHDVKTIRFRDGEKERETSLEEFYDNNRRAYEAAREIGKYLLEKEGPYSLSFTNKEVLNLEEVC